MSIRVALAAGTVFSLGGVAAIASQDPGPVTFGRLQARHPLAAYLALAAAPSGNGWELFTLLAFIYVVCIFAAGWRHVRRPDPRREP